MNRVKPLFQGNLSCSASCHVLVSLGLTWSSFSQSHPLLPSLGSAHSMPLFLVSVSILPRVLAPVAGRAS